MTTWKNNGETRANSCRKNDATSTSPRRCRYLWIAPRNQVMSKRRVMSDNPARRVIRISRPSQTAVKLGLRHHQWPGRQRRLDQNLVVGGFGDHQEPAVAQGRDGRQGRPGKPRPVGSVGAGFQSEVLGAPEHLRCANLGCSQAVPDLPAISRNALEMQQRHEGFEPRIGAVGFCAHARSPGDVVFRRAAASATAAVGSTPDQQADIPPCPSPAVTKLDAIAWPSRARAVACAPSAAVAVSPVLLLLAIGATVRD